MSKDKNLWPGLESGNPEKTSGDFGLYLDHSRNFANRTGHQKTIVPSPESNFQA